MSWDHIDGWCDGDAVPAWQVTCSTGMWRAKPIARLEPRDPDPRSQWARIIRVAELDPVADEQTVALWGRYTAAVEPES